MKLKKSEDGRFYDVTELPSRGMPYGGLLPNGTIEIYAMTAQMQKQVALLARRAPGEVVDKIIKSSLKTDIDSNILTSADRLYVLLFSRIISYPTSKRQFKVMNPHTGRQFDATVDLKELNISYLDESWSEPKEVTLPMCGDRVTIRSLRGADELEISSEVVARRARKKGKSDDDELGMIEATARQVVSINGNNKMERFDKEKWVSELLAGDIDFLNDEVTHLDGGVDFEIEVTDPSTGHTVPISLMSGEYSFLEV